EIPRCLREHPRLRGRCGLGGDEPARLVDMTARALALPSVPPELCQHGACLCSAGLGSRFDERVTSTLQNFVRALVTRGCKRTAEIEQELRQVGVVIRPELDCGAVEADRGPECVERERAVAGVPQRSARTRDEARRLA